MSWFIMDTALGLALMCLYLIFAQCGRILTGMRQKPHLAKKEPTKRSLHFWKPLTLRIRGRKKFRKV